MINSIVKLEDLIKAGVHIGQRSRYWNPNMFPYIYTKRKGVHIIDLVQTARLLTHAYNYVSVSARRGKTFLFIGTKKAVSNIISEEATKCNVYYVNDRWLGGTLTNWSTMKTRVAYLKELDVREKCGLIDLLPKKEASFLRRQHNKLKCSLGGLRHMETLPDIVILVDPKYEALAMEECQKLEIPIIALVDTDCNPNLVDIPIPGNAHGLASIKLILSILSKGIVKGKS